MGKTCTKVMKYQAGIGLVPDGVAWTGIIESLANRVEEKQYGWINISQGCIY